VVFDIYLHVQLFQPSDCSDDYIRNAPHFNTYQCQHARSAIYFTIILSLMPFGHWTCCCAD